MYLWLMKYQNDTDINRKLMEVNDSLRTSLDPIGSSTYYLVHVTAVVCLIISTIGSLSSALVTYFDGIRNQKGFYKWSIGPRLVVYLAAADFGYCLTHFADHVYILANGYGPPEVLCTVFAFSLTNFYMAQICLVFFMSVNAYYMVVWQKRFHLGKYDWRLIACTTGIPFSFCIVVTILGTFGFNGRWCLFNLEERRSRIVSNTVAICLTVIFLSITALYASVWAKLRQSSKLMTSGRRTNKEPRKRKLEKTAKILSFFVLVFIGQYWSYIVYSLWSWSGRPPLTIYMLVLTFCNLGGMLNFIAYTYIRKVYLKPNARQGMDLMSNTTQIRTETLS